MKDTEMRAAALYDGGWRSGDGESLVDEYELTQEEADMICAQLKKWETRTIEAAELGRLVSPEAVHVYSHSDYTISTGGGAYKISLSTTGELVTTADTAQDLDEALKCLSA
jgi:hypothetical protein